MRFPAMLSSSRAVFRDKAGSTHVTLTCAARCKTVAPRPSSATSFRGSQSVCKCTRHSKPCRTLILFSDSHSTWKEMIATLPQRHTRITYPQPGERFEAIQRGDIVCTQVKPLQCGTAFKAVRGRKTALVYPQCCQLCEAL
jgi:hypothetical protein